MNMNMEIRPIDTKQISAQCYGVVHKGGDVVPVSPVDHKFSVGACGYGAVTRFITDMFAYSFVDYIKVSDLDGSWSIILRRSSKWSIIDGTTEMAAVRWEYRA